MFDPNSHEDQFATANTRFVAFVCTYCSKSSSCIILSDFLYIIL